ncbi:MAG TPA: peptidylprolyl isomerase [Verrucomicrobiae bacterium]|nr:peptidylprolyl isomerase [Verrucomicrobiae bacterium]
MSLSISSRLLRTMGRMVVGVCGWVFLAGPARAVTLTLWTNNIVMPANRTFQLPVTASDPDGQPLKFTVTTSNKRLQVEFAPSSNPSLVINVSGVDMNTNPFTGDLVAQLFSDLTPTTTARIVTLVNSNFYNGLLFQRVISNFVAQCGGATTNINLESGVTIDDEYVGSLIYDGFGQLAMANQASASSAGNHDSNDSQFFITDVDLSIASTNAPSPEYLNFEQPIFGQLTSGFDVLAKIMSTPVGPNPDNSSEVSAPLSNVVMNSVTVITNSQDTVLRLTEIGTNSFGKAAGSNSLAGAVASNFLGNVTVTIGAANAENQMATQMLQVTVITDTNTSPPFWGRLPDSVTVSQGVATAFPITFTNIDKTSTSPSIEDSATGSFPTNILLTSSPHTNLYTFSPDATLTGTVHLVFSITDNIHEPDTHTVAFNVLAGSPTPTMTIVPLKGSMVDAGNKTASSTINVTGTFAFNSQSDQTFSSNDVISLSLGLTNNPLSLIIAPSESGWKLRKGVISGQGIPSNASSKKVHVSTQFDPAKGTFKILASGIDFPTHLTNNILQVGVAIGINYGRDVRPWVEIKPGTFVPPPPLVSSP